MVLGRKHGQAVRHAACQSAACTAAIHGSCGAAASSCPCQTCTPFRGSACQSLPGRCAVILTLEASGTASPEVVVVVVVMRDAHRRPW